VAERSKHVRRVQEIWSSSPGPP